MGRGDERKDNSCVRACETGRCCQQGSKGQGQHRAKLTGRDRGRRVAIRPLPSAAAHLDLRPHRPLGVLELFGHPCSLPAELGVHPLQRLLMPGRKKLQHHQRSQGPRQSQGGGHLKLLFLPCCSLSQVPLGGLKPLEGGV